MMASVETCAQDGDIAWRQQKDDREGEERRSEDADRALCPLESNCGFEEEAGIACVFGPVANALPV